MLHATTPTPTQKNKQKNKEEKTISACMSTYKMFFIVLHRLHFNKAVMTYRKQLHQVIPAK